MSEGAALCPVSPAERVDLLDVLRGFAILGILPVNLLGFSAPLSAQIVGFTWWTDLSDRVALQFIYFFAVGKFYSLLAFLFGAGFAIQLGRADARGVDLLPAYLRRLAALLVIGLAHAAFVWWGDVLHVYALLGVALLLFGASSTRTLLIAAGLCLALPAELAIFETLAAGMAPAGSSSAQAAVDHTAMIAESIAAHRQGGFGVMLRERLRTLELQESRAILTTVPQIFAMLLFGFAAARDKLLERIEGLRPYLGWALGIGVLCNLGFVLSQQLANPLQPSVASALGVCCYVAGAPALALSYVITGAILWQKPRARALLTPLRAVGRTALSNYLLQSVVFTSVFGLSGARLYGKVGPAGALLMALAFAGVQIALARWWLRHFERGPAEWLLRSVTYSSKRV